MKQFSGAVVAERSRSLLHGTGGPRFESRRRSIFSWNLASRREESLADSEMDARARSRARARVDNDYTGVIAK